MRFIFFLSEGGNLYRNELHVLKVILKFTVLVRVNFIIFDGFLYFHLFQLIILIQKNLIKFNNSFKIIINYDS